MTASARYAVVGDPVSHSLSPAMQSAALQAAGIDAEYEAVRVAAEDLPSFVCSLRCGQFHGLNVTVPHKEATARLVDSLAPSAHRLGAVNTIIYDRQSLEGHNTDADGFRRALSLLPVELKRGLAVILGAGGSARAVADVIASAGAKIVLVNRNVARAHELARDLHINALVLHRDDARLESIVPDAQLVVNATRLGLGEFSEVSALPVGIVLSPRATVVDLVYGRITPFLRHAREVGCRSQDGLEMLVQQGAESFRLWTGRDPDVTVMRDACKRRLEVLACSVS